jgi:type IV pilus assembly protein PilX
MSASYRSRCAAQDGMVLITTLLLLIVITLLALAMFRGAGLDNRIAGNVLDKQRALQAAESAQEYAEQWLYDDVTTSPLVNCGTEAAATTTPVICNEPLFEQTQPAEVPWAAGGAFEYTTDITTSTTGGENTLYGYPMAYIGYLGADATVPGAQDYMVDAWSYGGSEATVAVVQSTYQIRYTVASASGP